jgi:hypothetical protein
MEELFKPQDEEYMKNIGHMIVNTIEERTKN